MAQMIVREFSGEPREQTCSRRGMSVLEIWDFISGTDDTHPCDERFADEVLQILASQCGVGALRILDLGGGAGNPSIAMARAGHRVTLLDNDPSFLEAARRRSSGVDADLRVVASDWTRFLADSLARRSQFDVILFLGNSLAYQDSWPDRALPTISAFECLLPTLSACREILSPKGIIVVESPFESSFPAPHTYVRLRSPGQRAPNLKSAFCMEVVECDPANSARMVDTLVAKPLSDGIAPIQGRVRFTGHLLTESLMSGLADSLGMPVDFTKNWSRSFFRVCVLQRLEG